MLCLLQIPPETWQNYVNLNPRYRVWESLLYLIKFPFIDSELQQGDFGYLSGPMAKPVNH